MRVKHQVTESAISLRLAQGLEGVETANEEMHIEYLADRPDFIPTLARWHHEEWADLRPGDSVEARILRLQGSRGRGRIPLTVIAFWKTSCSARQVSSNTTWIAGST